MFCFPKLIVYTILVVKTISVEKIKWDTLYTSYYVIAKTANLKANDIVIIKFEK